jgi:Uma2 family endonuclease
MEDGAPAESIFVEKQRRLLTVPLYTSWTPSAGQTFRAFANVGLFNSHKEASYVPDAMLALNVPPANDPLEPDHRSYFMWVIGKPPDVVIEVVSDTRGGEDTRKRKHYAAIGVRFYVIFDPFQKLNEGVLRVFALHAGTYRPTDAARIEDLGLGLKLWDGEYETMRAVWLRWVDETGSLILTGKERAELETANAKLETKRADEAETKAAAAEARIRELEAKLAGS